MANKPFKKGDRVLCINDDFSNVSPREYKQCKFPVQGEEYTVREAFSGSIFLVEIVNPPLEGRGKEPTFYNFRFIKAPLIKVNTEEEDQKHKKDKEAQPVVES